MATHNFQIFDESMTDVMTDLDYQSDSQRTNGVIPGVADPLLHNKLYRQCSIMAYAIAQVISARGYNADDSDPAALANAIQRTFAFSVNGNVPNASGAVTAVRPIDAWPVGSLFMTFDNTNPNTLLGGGTWTQIKGKYLLAADTGDTVDGTTTVGAMTKNVPVPSHTHTFTTSSNGAHTHTATTASNGAHTHTRGSMNITGKLSSTDHTGTYKEAFTTSDAFTHSGALSISDKVTVTGYGVAQDNNEAYRTLNFNGANGWTGSTSSNGAHTHTLTTASNGAHTHTGTTESAGTSASFDVRPLSIYVYMWRRTA